MRRARVPVGFGAELSADSADLVASPPPDADADRREDLAGLTVYAIDDDGTDEVDDGVSAEVRRRRRCTG